LRHILGFVGRLGLGNRWRHFRFGRPFALTLGRCRCLGCGCRRGRPIAGRFARSAGRSRRSDRSFRSRATVRRAWPAVSPLSVIVSTAANNRQQDDGYQQNGSSQDRGQQRKLLRPLGPLSHHLGHGPLAAGLHQGISRRGRGSRCGRADSDRDGCWQVSRRRTGRRRIAMLTRGGHRRSRGATRYVAAGLGNHPRSGRLRRSRGRDRYASHGNARRCALHRRDGRTWSRLCMVRRSRTRW
jgi:hypothetical protein